MQKDLERKMSTDEENLESKAKISSSFLSGNFDVVVIMSFVWIQDENSADAYDYDDCEEWDE